MPICRYTPGRCGCPERSVPRAVNLVPAAWCSKASRARLVDKIISSSRVSVLDSWVTDKANKARGLCRDGPFYSSTLTGSYAETDPVGWPGSLGTSMDLGLSVCCLPCNVTLQCGQDVSFHWSSMVSGQLGVNISVDMFCQQSSRNTVVSGDTYVLR